MNLDILEAHKDEDANNELERLKAELEEMKRAAELSEK